MNEKRMVPLQVKMHTVDPRAFVRRDQGWFWEVQPALLSPVEVPVNTPPKNFFVESGSQILRMYFHYIREMTGAGVREAKEAPLGPAGSSLSMFLLSWHTEWLPGPHGPSLSLAQGISFYGEHKWCTFSFPLHPLKVKITFLIKDFYSRCLMCREYKLIFKKSVHLFTERVNL